MSRTSLIAGLLAVVALHGLLLGIYWIPEAKLLWGDEVRYEAVARLNASGGEASLDLLWPPLYPRFLALLLQIGGGSLLWVQLVQTALLAGTAWLARDVFGRLVAPGITADLFGLSFLLYPPLVAYAHYLWPEILHLALTAVAVWILAARRDRFAWLSALGLTLGLALLTKSVLGPFVPILLIPVAWGRHLGSAIARVGLVLLALVVTILPTMIFNQVHHGVFAIATSARFNLWVGLNDRSRRTFVDEVVGREYRTWRESADAVSERNAILTEKLSGLVRERGVLPVLGDQLSRQYHRLFERESFLTQQLPGGVIHDRGSGYRGVSPAIAATIRALSYSAYAALLAGAAFGLALYTPPSTRRWLWLALGFLAYSLALFLVVHVKSRYRVPLLPVLLMYAALAGQGWTDSSPSRSRLAVGGALALVVLWLAFGG